ncbi:FAD/NAD(P)-binding protein [Mucilaginibacter kameinonensis]|uniref:FAD/NAD(P)-binding protein n=1 Tax=Mucilaginibacter kameinonensis TaxID=452286 RepID=UPI000EF7BE78|nr:FAD/NAD(P)-binding protein [Mucilaginibacter kameinonensis]
MYKSSFQQVAILGGGPSALFIVKRFVARAIPELSITIFEKDDRLGYGMPYGQNGAADEHVTNVSGNEIPELMSDLADWIKKVPKDTLDKYHIDPDNFNDYKVLPRLLFGQYLNEQFNLLLKQARENGIETTVYYKSKVVDVIDEPIKKNVKVLLEDKRKFDFDRVIICTGHLWPVRNEGNVRGWFDSPYPPAKISIKADHAVAIRGSSLTAIDAIRTLGRHNGTFEKIDGKLCFRADTPNFKIDMYSRNGLLPAVRFHLEDSHLGKETVLPVDEVKTIRDQNEGFLPLDYVFEKNFKAGILKQDPEFYQQIKDMDMETFVDWIMEQREQADPFELLKQEYAEAEQSIRKRESVYWKEMLAILSFAMNYPAKYFSAEDWLRLQKKLMPLISVVIAFVPQSSAETLLAMHQAGKLDLHAVGEDGSFEPGEDGGVVIDGIHYQTFVDCIGQPHLKYEELPYPSLLKNRTLSPARLRFRNPERGRELTTVGQQKAVSYDQGHYYVTVPGVSINDSFQAVDEFNALNERIYIMAVPFIGGFNPDYSGLDFCEAASKAIIDSL